MNEEEIDTKENGVKLKEGDFVIYEGGIARVVAVGGLSQRFMLSWLHNPNNRRSLQMLHYAYECEVIPKDVAYNLVEVLKRNGK